MVLISLCISQRNANAQNFEKACGTDHVMQQLYKKHPHEKQEAKKLREKMRFASKSIAANKSYVIPVVFHVFGTQYNSNTTVTKAIIEDALRRTNEDFQGLNQDYTTIDAPFDVIKQPLNITFKLAKIDPNGNPTTGVIFHSTASGMGNYNSPEVRQVAWDNYKYCNIYITRDLYGNGDFYNSGVAWYPNKTMSDQNIARIVYNGSYLGTNTNENFRSVFTHEFGHYLDLPHTFDKGICNNNPNDGDGVADTPPHKKNSSGTQCNKVYNCFNNEINNENFMDYTDCYKMFTKGQVQRMINALENSPTRNTLWTPENLIATGVNSELGPSIIANGSTFNERFLNDGIIEQTIDISCEKCTFTKSSGTLIEGTDYTTTNLPNGLTSKITVNSNTQATITLEGNANSHASNNSISNLSFKFLNSSITGGTSQLQKDSIDNLKITFKNPYTEYCNVNIRFAVYTHITNVSFNNTNNPSGYDGTSNNISTTRFKVKKGETYPLSITTNKGNGGNNDNLRVRVWADWNNNFIYEDNELVINKPYKNSQTDTNGNYTLTQNITIPNNATLGNTAFRVLAHYVQGNEGDFACSTIDSGESEDYGLEILPSNTPFEVDFSTPTPLVNFSDQVNFNDLSIAENGDQVVSWNWEFEGGTPSSSTSRNPQNIIFRNPGKFNVSLEVTTQNGLKKKITKSEYITSRLSYCSSSPKFGTYFSVNKVNLNTINHQPGKSNYYNYYDTVNTELQVSKTYPITIKCERGNGGQNDTNRVRIWADWNFDSKFTSDELVSSKIVTYSDYDSNGEYEFTTNVTVPNNAAINKKIGFRIVGHFIQGNEGDTACGQYDSGNTLDYGVTIKSQANPNATITAISNASAIEGNNLIHTVTLNKTTTLSNTYPLLINNGTAILGTDFNNPTFSNGVTYNNGSIIVPANISSFSITIPTVDNTTDESDKNYTIQSGNISGIGTIQDNDEPSTGNYCYAANLRNDSYISNVSFGTINNTSTHNPYSNFTNLSSTFNSGEQFVITIKTKNDHWSYNNIAVWIDWNNDGTFSNNENVYNVYQPGPYNANVSIPNSTKTNTNLRMRIRYSYGASDAAAPCGEDSYFGEVEDYTIRVSNNTSTNYCAASTLRNDAYISNVSFGNINNTTTHSPYTNYTNNVQTFSVGQVFNISVSTSQNHWSYNGIGVWIDWNNDGAFSNNENVYKRYGAGPYAGNVVIPNNATTNTPLRMRVRYAYGAENRIVPCGTDTYFGEVEDYTIKINSNSLNGVSGANENQKIQFYPNPAKDFIVIKTFVNTPLTYTIVNLQGQLMIHKTITPKSLNTRLQLNNLSSGIYLLKILQGRSFINKKIIITK